MAALPHAPASPKTRTCCCTQALISRCQGRLWLSTVTGWVLDFPASAAAACQCRKPLWVMVCFPIARTGHQHGDCDFVNDVRLLQNTLPGIDAECLVPPRGSLSNHTLGVRWLPIPSRAALFEWFKGIFDWKVIAVRCSQCTLYFHNHSVLWCSFFQPAVITQRWNIHPDIWINMYLSRCQWVTF